MNRVCCRVILEKNMKTERWLFVILVVFCVKFTFAAQHEDYAVTEDNDFAEFEDIDDDDDGT